MRGRLPQVFEYEGNAAVQVVDVGFEPQFVLITNTEDGDESFLAYKGMADDTAIKLSGAQTFTGSTPTFTGSTPAFTGSTPAFTGTAIATEALVVKDDDNAASSGVAVYLHTKDGITGWLEFVSPTNADGTYTLNNGGGKGMIFDADAAATDGVVVYLDEDGANADERLLCVSPSAQDIMVPVNANKCLRIKHDASAASNGVQVYFDEDAANTYERLMFVSPTNTNGAGATDDTLKPFGSVSAGTNAQVTGTNAQVTGTISQVTGTVTAGHATLGSNGITIGTKGVKVGTSLSENGKTYRLCAW